MKSKCLGKNILLRCGRGSICRVIFRGYGFIHLISASILLTFEVVSQS